MTASLPLTDSQRIDRLNTAMEAFIKTPNRQLNPKSGVKLLHIAAKELVYFNQLNERDVNDLNKIMDAYDRFLRQLINKAYPNHTK